MRLRESGMPEEAYWETLFDVPLILYTLTPDKAHHIAMPKLMGACLALFAMGSRAWRHLLMMVVARGFKPPDQNGNAQTGCQSQR